MQLSAMARFSAKVRRVFVVGENATSDRPLITTSDGCSVTLGLVAG
jgi:hypothetical protein